MGWGCAAEADETMRKLTAACIKQTGVQNVFKLNGKVYMWEISRREQEDGSITGSMFTMDDVMKPTWSKRAGSFKISADGKIERGTGLKALLGGKGMSETKYIIRCTGTKGLLLYETTDGYLLPFLNNSVRRYDTRQAAEDTARHFNDRAAAGVKFDVVTEEQAKLAVDVAYRKVKAISEALSEISKAP